MANNGKGKSIYIGTEDEEFDKVLRTYYLNDLLLDAYGGEPIELRTKILTHLRKQDGYYEALLSDDDEEEEEKQEPVDTVLPKFDELEQKISNLEKVFKYLKEKKDKKEKELKKKKKMGDAEGSGSNY